MSEASISASLGCRSNPSHREATTIGSVRVGERSWVMSHPASSGRETRREEQGTAVSPTRHPALSLMMFLTTCGHLAVNRPGAMEVTAAPLARVHVKATSGPAFASANVVEKRPSPDCSAKVHLTEVPMLHAARANWTSTCRPSGWVDTPLPAGGRPLPRSHASTAWWDCSNRAMDCTALVMAPVNAYWATVFIGMDSV